MEQLTVCASESPSLLATIPQHYLFVGWDRAILSVGIEYSFILGQKSYDKIFYVSNYSYFAVSLLCDWVWVRDYFSAAAAASTSCRHLVPCAVFSVACGGPPCGGGGFGHENIRV